MDIMINSIQNEFLFLKKKKKHVPNLLIPQSIRLKSFNEVLQQKKTNMNLKLLNNTKM